MKPLSSKSNSASKEKYPGKVKPLSPVSNEPRMADKIKEQALKEAQEQYGDNVFGDVIAMLGGADANAQLQKMQESRSSKAMLEKFQTEVAGKTKIMGFSFKNSSARKRDSSSQRSYRTKSNTKILNLRRNCKLFARLDKVFKDGDAMYKQIQSTGDDLGKDLKALELNTRPSKHKSKPTSNL